MRVERYRVERSINGDRWYLVGVTNSRMMVEFIDSPISLGDRYEYRVIAVGFDGSYSIPSQNSYNFNKIGSSMPHIKFKNFSITDFKPDRLRATEVLFIANDSTLRSTMVGVKLKGVEFLLELKRDRRGSWILKYDKVTRPLDVNLLKEAIGDIADGLNLDIIYSIYKAIKSSNLQIVPRRAIESFENIKFPYDS